MALTFLLSDRGGFDFVTALLAATLLGTREKGKNKKTRVLF